MEVNNVFLEAVAVKAAQYPASGLPEIAFVGKSNVGKSSLLNTMVNRKSLARTSGTPGKTRTINFYNVESLLYFVDLPGYGYAKLSKSESEKWGQMIEGYLNKRRTLACIVMLIDIRHEPSANDLMMYEWLTHYEHTVVAVATKLDKVSRNEANKNLVVIKKSLGLDAGAELLAFSSATKQGKKELWEIIEAKAGLRLSENK